jgi:hypothetical protein
LLVLIGVIIILATGIMLVVPAVRQLENKLPSYAMTVAPGD